MSTPDSSLEIERKYAVDAGFVLPDLSAVPGVAAVTGPRTYHLTAIYHDTPGQRLAAARITLRRRTGGTDAGWHLKLPAGAGARREVHAPLGPGTEGVPAELAGLVSEQTGGEPLRPIARLQTTRTVRHLVDSAGQVLAEVADDEVTGSIPAQHGGRTNAPPRPDAWQTVIAWREVEIELGRGPAGLLDAAGSVLLDAGARLSPAASKLGLLLSAASSQDSPASRQSQYGGET
jgi:inorganic triphosphatase YgiF